MAEVPATLSSVFVRDSWKWTHEGLRVVKLAKVDLEYVLVGEVALGVGKLEAWVARIVAF